MKTFIVSPLITEKSMAQSMNSVYTFVVPTWANKRQIAEFIERHFGVTVLNVTTARMRGESVRFRQRAGQQAAYKKAVVRLQAGQSIADYSLPVESQNTDTPTVTGTPEGEPATESKITVRNKTAKKAGA